MRSMSDHESRPPGEILRERCAAAGYLVWSVDTQGRILQEPSLSEAAGLFLKSGAFTSLIEQQVTEWAGRSPSRTVELWPGCSLLGVATRTRGRTTGYLVVTLIEPCALEDVVYENLCAQAVLDVDATREALNDYAVSAAGEHDRLEMLLAPMREDLERTALDNRTIDGFTNHLGDAYEQMALLHELGRSMTRFTRPIEFFETVLERLADTLHFRWFCVMIADDPDLPAEIAGKSFSYGMGRISDESLNEPLWHWVRSKQPGESTGVLSLSSLGITGGGQIVAQPIVRDDHTNAILIAGGKRGDDPQVSSYDTKLISSVSGYVGTFLDNARLEVRRNAMFVGSIRALTALVDAKDQYTQGHSERVALLAKQLGAAMGLPIEVVERIHLSGLLHDVGKVGVPEAVLTKRSRLTEEEFELIKLHPQLGYDVLKGIPDFEDILEGVLAHHERWDGMGYPDRVAGDEIPLFGRVMCLADSFDAMSSNRAYRAAMPREKVISEIIACGGKQFDPKLAPIFAAMDFTAYDELLEINAHRATQFKAA